MEVISSFLQEEYCLPQSGHHKASQSKDCSNETEIQKQKKYHQLQQKTYAISRNAKKRQDRRDVIIQQQKANIKSQQDTIHECERKIEAVESKIFALKAKLARVNHHVAYWRAKVSDSKAKDSAKHTEYSKKIEELKQDVFISYLQNAELREIYILN